MHSKITYFNVHNNQQHRQTSPAWIGTGKIVVNQKRHLSAQRERTPTISLPAIDPLLEIENEKQRRRCRA
eukprot:scaffold34080_cov29-Attheya_sp.AAC.1